MPINIISFYVTTLMTPSAVRDVLCEPVRDTEWGAKWASGRHRAPGLALSPRGGPVIIIWTGRTLW